MPTFPNYRGALPERLNPLKLQHYFLLLYWVFFRPTALQCYFYQANPDLYQKEGVLKLRDTWRARGYRNLYLMFSCAIALLTLLLSLLVFLFTTNSAFGHGAPVNAVASISGQQVISASSDGILKVWDYSRSRALHTTKGHDDTISVLAVTPDGKRAISGAGDRSLKVWDLGRLKQVRRLKGHTRWISSVKLLPDERAISGGGDRTLKIWDLKQGKVLYTLAGHTAPIAGITVTSDGQLGISASSDRTLRVWDLQRGTELHTLTGHAAAVTDVALLPQRRAISASGDRTLKVWDLERGTEIHTLIGHTGWVTAVAITPDGQQAISASSDSTLKVWDLQRGKELHTLTGHSGWVNAVLTTSNGQQAISAASDRTIKVWDLQQAKELQTLSGNTSWVTAMAVLPGERIISAASDGKLKIWNLTSGTEQSPDGANGIGFLSVLALGLVSGLVVLTVLLTVALVLAIGFMVFGATGAVLSGAAIGLAGSLAFIMCDLLVQHLELNPSFRQVYGGFTISVWVMIIAGIAFGSIVSTAFGLANRSALGVIGSVLSILVMGVLVGLVVAGLVNNSAISVRGRLLPGIRIAILVGAVFNSLVFLGAVRTLFYPFQLGLALRSTFRGKGHPVEWDDLVILPLPGTSYCLQKQLSRDERGGLLAIANVACNPFQRDRSRLALQTYLHLHLSPLHFLYALFVFPDLDACAIAPVSRSDWQQLPTSRQLLLGLLGGHRVECSNDRASQIADSFVWNLTSLWRGRRSSPLTNFALMLYKLTKVQAIDASVFNLSEYRKTYAPLTDYPGGVEIAESFEALTTFLSYDRLSDLSAAADIANPLTKQAESAIRPSVLKAITRLGEIGAEVTADQDTTIQVDRLAALARAKSDLDTLDEYVLAEVVYPEQPILRRIIHQWSRLVSKELHRELGVGS